MKRCFIILVLTVCLLLTACGGNTDIDSGTQKETESDAVASTSGLDAQNKYAIFNAVSFQETDNFFCGSTLLGDQLYYYDKETGISGILCADPACSHDGSSCGAFVKNGASMFLYDGQRYWITDDYSDGRDPILWQGDIGGTNQKQVKTISFENILLPYQPQQYAIHRGSLYFLGSTDTVSGVSTGTRLTLMGSPLDDSEEFTALFDQTYDSYVKAGVRFVGNHAYFFVQTWTEAIENPPVDLTVYQIDLSSGETKTAFEELGGTSCTGFWVTEQNEIYLLNLFSLSKVEKGKLIPVASLNHTDGSTFLMDGIAVSPYLEDDQRCIELVGFSGNMLYDGKMFPAGIPGMDGDPNQYQEYGLVIIGGDSDKLIISLDRFDGKLSEHCVVLLDLNNNLEPTLLWKVQ